VRGRDGLIYVPNTVTPGIIEVFSLDEHHMLTLLDTIEVPYPVDNLSVDKNGDIFAASFPQVYKWAQSSKDPFNVKVPSAVVRIRKGEMKGKNGKGREGVVLHGEAGDWEVEVILEDDGSVVGGASIAVHDAETGRIFTGGAVAPFISICETR
jgi:arylesterase/paraoxonase